MNTSQIASDLNSIPTKDVKFDVDMLNVRGTLRFRVMAETFPKYQEVARVEIPISSVLDCCCILPENGLYEAWFPLTRMIDQNLSASDISVQSFESKTEQFQFGDYDQSLIRIRLKWDSSGSREEEKTETVSSKKDFPVFYNRLQVPSFSVSLVDSDHARAVMLATIIGTEMRRGVTKEHTDLSINVTTLHVDNQLPDSYCPVIVAPTTVKFPQPVIRVHVRKNNVISKANLSCYKTIQMVVQELDVKLEQQTVLASWELVKTLMNQKRQSDTAAVLDTKLFDNLEMTNLIQENGLPSPFTKNNSMETPKKASNHLLKSFQSPQKADRQAIRNLLEDTDVLKLYIENFSISSIKINVSFFTTPQHIVEHYRNDTKADLRNERALGIFSAISFFLWQVGEVVLDLTSSISDAPINFNGFQAAYLFKTALDIQETLLEHYLHNALGQLYKIVGSLDLVGNPIGLLSSLGLGVHDFFYEPAHALINNPTEIGKIGKGVVKGTVSLVSNTTDGFLGTGTTITRSVGRGFAKLSMDSSFLKAREKLQKPPSTFGDIVTRPMKDVGNGFYYGVVGLVKVPYNSVKRHGAVGFVPGVAKGVAGLAADPIVGILDAVTHSGDAFRGILKSTTKERESTALRIRFSEIFGVDGRLLPYNHNIALGTQIIQFLSKTPIAANNKSAVRSPDGRPRSESLIRMASPSTPMKRENVVSSATTNRNSLRKNADGITSLVGSLYPSPPGVGLHHDNSILGALAFSKSEGGEMECVIYTAVLQKGEIVAILTTQRVVVVEIPRKQNKTSFPRLKWEADYSTIEACHWGEERNRNWMLKLKIVEHNTSLQHYQNSSSSPETSLQNKRNRRKSLVQSSLQFVEAKPEELMHTITLNHQDPGSIDLINFVDCLQTILHLKTREPGDWPHLVNQNEDDSTRAVRQDEFGIRYIGPWRYILHGELEKRSENIQDQVDIVRDLELEGWHFQESSDTNAKPKPSWLLEEEKRSLDAHNKISELVSWCHELLKSPQSNIEALKKVIHELETRAISAEEFLKRIDQIQTKPNGTPSDDPSTGENEVNHGGKKGVFLETVGNVAKFASNVMFKKSKPMDMPRSKASAPQAEDFTDGKETSESHKPWSNQVSRSNGISSTMSVSTNQSVVSSSSDEIPSSNHLDVLNKSMHPADQNFTPIEKADDDSVPSANSQLSAFFLPGRSKGRKSLDSSTSHGENSSMMSDIQPDGSLYEDAYEHSDVVKEENNPLLSRDPS
jgi:hypothetical protein